MKICTSERRHMHHMDISHLYPCKKGIYIMKHENPYSFSVLRFRSGVSTQSFVLSFIVLWFRSGASTRSLVSSYDSVREHQPGVSYLHKIPFGSNNPESRIAFLTIPFGSINPKSRIFLRFRSGASTRSLVSFYDSVREHQPGVSYLLRFRLGASTRSLVSFYDSVREHQPGVSYFPTVSFGKCDNL